MVRTCWCGFIDVRHLTTPVAAVGNGGGYACGGAGGIWEISVVSPDFVANLKVL